MDVFNPPERQHIIPPPPPTTTTTTTTTTSTSTTTTNNLTFSSGDQTNANNYNNTSSNNNNNVTVTIDTKQMQSELERRQQELEIKAAELAAREEALRQGGGEFRRQHNWPPLPSFCPFKPCFFQDINVDIRPEFQRIVQLGYHLWIAFVFIQLLNIFTAILMLSYGIENSGSNLSFGLVTFIFFMPLTYMSWFRPLYKAFKNDSSFNFMVFFFVFFMQTLIVGLWSLGLPADGGPCGLYVALKNMSTSVLLAMVLFLVTAAWGSYTAASVFYLLRVHSIYRASGASIAKARNEFAQGIITNQYVQQTVANAARSTVNQTFAAATGGATTTTSNNNQPLSGQPR